MPLKQLLGPMNKQRSVTSLVGMGGLGKTTVANKIYISTEVGHHLATCAWASVSKDCRIAELLKDIIQNLMKVKRQDVEHMHEEALKEKLYEFLKEKKYFILLDDEWTTDVWESIKSSFPDMSNGSTVMITTRSLDVAKHADHPLSTPHELECLSPAESWELFIRTVLPSQHVQTICPDELVEIGQQLAKKCGGLPLALVVVGGFLSRNRKSPDFWLRVAKSMKWQSTKDGERCMNVLGLSYNDLPYYLKSCFLYFAGFAEDSLIPAGKLIRLWIAEGFIPQRRGEKLEETAEDCLEELASRCLVQVEERKGLEGSIKKLRIHDFLHDFSITEAKDVELFNMCNHNVCQNCSNAARRLTLYHVPLECVNAPSLHTILGFISVITRKEIRLIFRRFKLLRVLDLEGTNLGHTSLPEDIKSMIHLKYLGLRGSKLKELHLLGALSTYRHSTSEELT